MSLQYEKETRCRWKNPRIHERMVQFCLSYIKDCSQDDWCKRFTFLSYASGAWFLHAQACGKSLSNHTKAEIVKMLDNPGIWTYRFDPEQMILLTPGNFKRRVESYMAFGEHAPTSSSLSNAAFYYAACLELVEVIKFLSMRGMTPNDEQGLYGTALQVATARENASLVVTLIENGADVDQRARPFGRALNTACCAGNFEIAKILIDAGAKVNSVYNSDDTSNVQVQYDNSVLWDACCGGNVQIVQLLLEAGACVTSSDGSPGENVLDHMRKLPHPSPEIIIQLLQNNALSSADETTRAWLMRWAARSGCEDVVRLLLNKFMILGKTSFKWTIDRSSYHSCVETTTVPYESVFRQQDAIAKILIRKWDNINEADRQGRTSLYWACVFQRPAIVKELLDQGASVHSTGPYGWSARYWTTLFNDQEIMKMLDEACDASSCRDCMLAKLMAKIENLSLHRNHKQKTSVEDR